MNVKALRKLEKWIEAEPRRFDMKEWAGTEAIIEELNPRCGTVGCLAGMACHMEGYKLRPGYMSLSGPKSLDVQDTANDILDLDLDQSERLFYLSTHKPEMCWPAKFEALYTKAKTPAARVKVAVARIEHFIKTKGKE